MDDYSGYYHTTQVLEKLSGQSINDCLQGLKYAESGQKKCKSGNYGGGIEDLQNAENIFRNIPHASPLLGIVLSDLSEMWLYMNSLRKMEASASEAISLLNKVAGLNSSKAVAFKNIGIAHYANGNSEKGLEYFNVAKQLFKDLPDSHTFIKLLKDLELKYKEDAKKKLDRLLLTPDIDIKLRKFNIKEYQQEIDAKLNDSFREMGGSYVKPDSYIRSPHEKPEINQNLVFSVSMLVILIFFISASLGIFFLFNSKVPSYERVGYAFSIAAILIFWTRSSLVQNKYPIISRTVIMKWRIIFLVVPIILLLAGGLIAYFKYTF